MRRRQQHRDDREMGLQFIDQLRMSAHLHSQRRPVAQEIRTTAELNQALDALGLPAVKLRKTPYGHQTDALVTAVGMLAHLTNPRAFDAPA